MKTKNDENLVVELGARAKMCREQARYKVTEVADALGVSRVMVYLFEGGQTKGNISLTFLQYYVNMFGLDVNGLLREFNNTEWK